MNKIVSKFVAKLLKYRKLSKDIFTFLELDYRADLLSTLYLVVTGIKNYFKNQIDRIIISHKKNFVDNFGYSPFRGNAP